MDDEDMFQKMRVEPTGEQLGKERAIKNGAEEFAKIINDLVPSGGRRSKAILHLEEAVMLAVKEIMVA